MAGADEGAEAPVKPGQSIAGGKYRVEQVLGVGGMGVVVAATHVQLQQRVAIKFMLASALRDKEAVDRFLREARSAAALKSEHVTRVLDVGTLDNGAPYIVMEFLEGITLDKVLDGGRVLSVGEAVEYTVQVCEAVAEAHARDIIHRDLKLANLFLTKAADQRPLVKVIDFGLSKDIRPDSLRITKDFVTLGTPAYMSPEQLRNAGELDARADIWALGVALFELLTAQLPFEAGSIPEICALVLGAPPRSVRQLRAEVPEELAAVIARCLQKDPAMRYADVAGLAEALDPFLPTGTARAGERIRSVQSARKAIPELVSSSSGIENFGRKTASSWNTDGTIVSRPTHRGWFVLTAIVAALGALAVAAVIVALRPQSTAPPVATVSTERAVPSPPTDSVAPAVEPAPTATAGAAAASIAPSSSAVATPRSRQPVPRETPPSRDPAGRARVPSTPTAAPDPDSMLERR